MTKTIYEYYCDCCEKRVEKEDDLNYVKLILDDEKCTHSILGDSIPRINTINSNSKYFCETCYTKYRKAIKNFVSVMAEFGIEEDDIL